MGIAEDMHKGLIDRFRSLPMKASAVLFGRTVADAARMILVLTVLTITGLVVGWRINDGFINAVFASATPDGKDMVAGELRGDPAADEALGQELADRLRTQGAGAILEKLAACA